MSNQDGSDNTQQNIDEMRGGTVKGRETNIHLGGVLVTVVALALVVLVGLIVLRPAEAPAQPTATPTPTPIPAGSQPESYLFYVDVSANMNKVIGGKRAYDWAQDVIAGILNRIRVNPANTRSGLLKVGGGESDCDNTSLIGFERGRSIPLQDYLAPLQQGQPQGNSAYTAGFAQVLDYFDPSPQEKKYLIVFMGSPFGTPGCYQQDIIDLPGLIDAYTASGIDVELCAFSFFSDLGEYDRLRRRIEDYGVECVNNITNASEAEAASSRTISIISNNRVLFENTPTPAPPTVTRTLTPTPRPTDTPAATTPPTATATSSLTVTPNLETQAALLLTATATPITCPGTLPSRLQLGQTGRVVPGAEANRVRTQPTSSGAQVARLDAGSTFTVVDGPRCADGYAWYLVRSSTTEGWTAEADNQSYWLEPLLDIMMTIYRQDEAIILYIPVTIPQIDFFSLTIRSEQNEINMGDDFLFRNDDVSVNSNTDVCLVYKREGTNPALPRSCPPDTTYEFSLIHADVFWWDNIEQRPVDFTVSYQGISTICEASADVCFIDLVAPIPFD